MIRKFFSYSEMYDEITKQFTIADTWYALLLYFVIMISYWGMGRYFYSLGERLSGGIFYMIEACNVAGIVALVLLVCHFRGQGMDTIGLGKESWMLAVKDACIGLVVIIVVVAVAYLLGGRVYYSIGHLIGRFLYYAILIAMVEELFFRGYLGPRLYGAACGKWWSITIAAICFSLVHVPFQAVFQHIPFLEYVVMVWPQLVFTFVFHIVMQWIFAKRCNLLVPIMIHTFWNFLQEVIYFQ